MILGISIGPFVIMRLPVEWLPVLIKYISESMPPKEYEMTYVACSPILMLTILAVSGVISLLYELSTTSTTNTAIAVITPQVSKIGNKTAADRFGITEIYPTKPDGGREWYFNTTSPLTGKNFFLSGGPEKTNSTLANATSSNGQIKKTT